MISVPTMKESDLFVILPVKGIEKAIGVVSGEDRSSIFTISAKSREKYCSPCLMFRSWRRYIRYLLSQLRGHSYDNYRCLYRCSPWGRQV